MIFYQILTSQRENTNFIQILTRLCFSEKISTKRKNEKMKDHMEKTVITTVIEVHLILSKLHAEEAS